MPDLIHFYDERGLVDTLFLDLLAAGKHKGHSPYGRLGLKLPPGRWWDLLQKEPELLAQELSALNPAA